MPGATRLKNVGGSRGCLYRVLGSFLLALTCNAAARAAEDSLLPIELGRILFFPSVALSYAQEDNVERRSQDDPLLPVVASSVQEVRPTLRFDAPFLRSFTTLAYSAKIKDYGAEELESASGTSHYVDFAQQYQITPSLRLDLQDSFLRGITELADLDPGGELRFGVQPFRSNSAQALLSLQMGPVQSLELGGNLSSTRFDDTGQLGLIQNFRSEGLLARYVVALGPSNWLFLVGDWQSASRGRTVLDIEPTDYWTRSIGLGMRRGGGLRVTSELRVSYATLDFPEGGEAFRGITAEGSMGFQLGATAQVALKLRRGPRFSFFNSNSFYLNEMMEIGYTQHISSRLRMLMRLAGQDNSYPEPVRIADIYSYLLPSEGSRRRDHLRGGAVRFVYHMGRAIDLQLEYHRDRVRSNIVAQSAGEEYKIFDYDSESLTTALIVGWQ